jgi:hypothetical protein
LNAVRAGNDVPLKLSLGGDQGLKIVAPDPPASGPIDCKLLVPAGELQPAMSAGARGPTYDAMRKPVHIRLEDGEGLGRNLPRPGAPA